MREQGTLLRHVAHLASLGRDTAVRSRDRPLVEVHGAVVGVQETGDDAEHRGLAAPGGAEHGHDLAVRHLQVASVEDATGPEGLADAAQRHPAHRASPGRACRLSR